MVQLLAGIISLRRVLEANPGRSHGSADTLPLRHSANYNNDDICESRVRQLSNNHVRPVYTTLWGDWKEFIADNMYNENRSGFY